MVKRVWEKIHQATESKRGKHVEIGSARKRNRECRALSRFSCREVGAGTEDTEEFKPVVMPQKGEATRSTSIQTLYQT